MTGLHHGANGLDRQSHHLAAGGGFDVGAAQIVGDGVQFFVVRQHFAADFGQLGFDLFAVFLLAREGALAQLADAALGAHGVALQVGQRRAVVGHHAFHFQLAVARGVALGHQAAQVGEFFIDQALLVAPILKYAGVGLQQALLALDVFFDGLHV